MALTLSLLAQDIHRLRFLGTSDGQGGGSAVVSNSALVGANGFGSGLCAPALQLLQKAYTNQAAARAAINEGGPFSLRAIPRDGSAAWGVDVGVDGNGLPTLVVTAGAATSHAIIEFVKEHSEIL